MDLSVISYNLWDDSYIREERLEWIIENIIKMKRPDIVLLQEVTNHTVLILAKRLRELGYQFKVANNGRKTYELIASLWSISAYKFQRFSNSKTGRGVLWGTVKIRNISITIASSQLEKDSSKIRMKQLNCMLKSLEEKSNCVIIGCDTGIDEENYVLDDTEWRDAWIENGKNKFYRYTVDFNRNKNVATQQSRPDRIFYKGHLSEPEFLLLGTNNECGTEKTQPSFHFGIQTKFVIN